MVTTFLLTLLACVAAFCTTHVLGAQHDLYVTITILESATAQGTVCLDGSPPAYHLHRGHGTGLGSWIIYLDAILSGTSAGGLATIWNCNKFKCLFLENARVKCVEDASFFINGSRLRIWPQLARL